MLKEIFKKNRLGILGMYSVMLVENVIFAFYPFMFGKAVDGLVVGDCKVFKIYLCVMVGGVMVGVARRIWDTRIFSRVWRKVGTDTILNLMKRRVESSKVITRGELSTRYVDFFEFYLPDGFRSVIWMGMSLVMMWLVVPAMMVWIVLLAGCAIVLARFVSIRRKTYDHAIMDSVDESNRAIQNNDEGGVIASYDSRTRNYIKSSDWEAMNWGTADLMSMGAEAIVILALIEMRESTGSIIATVAYVEMLFRNIGSLSYFFVNLRAIEVANEKIEEC